MLKIVRRFIVFIKCKGSIVSDIVIPALYITSNILYLNCKCNVFRLTENGIFQTEENPYLSKKDLTFFPQLHVLHRRYRHS